MMQPMTLEDLETWLKKHRVELNITCGASRWWVLLYRGQAICAGGMGDTMLIALREAVTHYERDHGEAACERKS